MLVDFIAREKREGRRQARRRKKAKEKEAGKKKGFSSQAVTHPAGLFKTLSSSNSLD